MHYYCPFVAFLIRPEMCSLQSKPIGGTKMPGLGRRVGWIELPFLGRHQQGKGPRRPLGIAKAAPFKGKSNQIVAGKVSNSYNYDR